MPSSGSGTIQTRQQLESWLQTGDKPTQSQLYDLVQSYFHRTEDSLPGIDHDPAQEYEVGAIVWNASTATLYRCKVAITSGVLTAAGGSIALTNGTYWEKAVTDLTIIDVADKSNPTELANLTSSAGNIVLVRFTGESPKTAGLYAWHNAVLSANAPYVVPDASGSGTWIAGPRFFSALNVGGDVDVSGDIDTGGDIDAGGNIDAGGDLTAQGDVNAAQDVTATQWHRGGGMALGHQFEGTDGATTNSDIGLNDQTRVWHVNNTINSANSHVLPAITHDGQEAILFFSGGGGTLSRTVETSGTDEFDEGTTSWDIPGDIDGVLFIAKTSYADPPGVFGGTSYAARWHRFTLRRDVGGWLSVNPSGTGTNPEFSGDWGNFSGIAQFEQALRVRRIGDIVYVDGNVESASTSGVTTTIFTLPAGMRPAKTRSALVHSPNHPDDWQLIFVKADGAVVIEAVSAGDRIDLQFSFAI